MIFQVKKDDKTIKIEDTIFFRHQKKNIQAFLNEHMQNNLANFDNCTVQLLSTGRIIITEKEVHDAE